MWKSKSPSRKSAIRLEKPPSSGAPQTSLQNLFQAMRLQDANGATTTLYTDAASTASAGTGACTAARVAGSGASSSAGTGASTPTSIPSGARSPRLATALTQVRSSRERKTLSRKTLGDCGLVLSDTSLGEDASREHIDQQPLTLHVPGRTKQSQTHPATAQRTDPSSPVKAQSREVAHTDQPGHRSTESVPVQKGAENATRDNTRQVKASEHRELSRHTEQTERSEQRVHREPRDAVQVRVPVCAPSGLLQELMRRLHVEERAGGVPSDLRAVVGCRLAEAAELYGWFVTRAQARGASHERLMAESSWRFMRARWGVDVGVGDTHDTRQTGDTHQPHQPHQPAERSHNRWANRTNTIHSMQKDSEDI